MIAAVDSTRSVRSEVGRALLSVYKSAVSPLIHAVSGSAGACRFQPSCSEYAALAVEYHGIFHGTWLALRRVSKCHPFHPPEFDPVPVPPSVARSVLAAAPVQSSPPPVTIEETVSAEPAASRPLSQPSYERR